MPETFPFGQPVLPAQPSAPAPRDVLVLGAYPSAVHVAWVAPGGFPKIQALPVDNEPEPFWTGKDELERIESWKGAVNFDESVDGTVAGVKGLNGSSGVALDRDYLEPLGIDRSETCTTDCLLTYYASDGVESAIEKRFLGAMAGHRPAPQLAKHPSERTIISEGSKRADELRELISTVQPARIITLGNAAARVLQVVLETGAGPVPLQKDAYGSPIEVNGRAWLPLAHPGATRQGRPWHEVHEKWKGSVRAK